MSRIVEVIRNSAHRPVEAIQVVVALVVFVLSVYIASPWFIPSTGSAASAAFGNNWLEQSIVGIIMLVPAIPILLSLLTVRFQTIEWYSRSTLGMFSVLLFLMLLRVIAIGLLPLTWVPTLGLALIIGVCHLYWKDNA